MGDLLTVFPWISTLAGVAAVVLLVRAAVPSPDRVAAFLEETMDESRRNKWRRLGDERPAIAVFQNVLLMIGVHVRSRKAPSTRAYITPLLIAAGYPGALNVETFVAVIAVGAVAGAGLGIFFGLNLTQGFSPPLFVIMTGLGTYLPVMWLKERVQQRRWKIARDLPYKIDLLLLNVEAGMNLQAALENVVKRDHTNSPLREELFETLQAIQLGKTRRTALREMAERVGIDSLNSLVGNILQGEAMGTPIGQVLKVQAEMLRVQRSYRAEKIAGEAPVKMIFPLLFIFLAVFLVLFGSIVVRYLRGEFTV